MKLEIILLGALRSEPSTGYELTRFLDNAGRFMRSNTTMSQVYRTLAAMEKRGWVEHEVESKAGASDLKRFRVTEEGEAELLDWLTGPYNPPSRFQDPDLYARLAYAGLIGRERVLEILETEISTRIAEIARYRERDRYAMPIGRDGDDLEFAVEMGEWLHRQGAAAIDRHVEALVALRERLLNGEPATDVSPQVRERALGRVRA
jgi:DNA-binding PadR family transcriptional regulator